MKIKKQNLLLLASLVWMIAGFNVLRIGIETYAEYQTVINYIVTIIVFLLFWFMVFYKLTNKHTIRIQGYEEEKQLFYKFFWFEIIFNYGVYDKFRDYYSFIPFTAGAVYSCILHRIGSGTFHGRRFIWKKLYTGLQEESISKRKSIEKV